MVEVYAEIADIYCWCRAQIARHYTLTLTRYSVHPNKQPIQKKQAQLFQNQRSEQDQVDQYNNLDGCGNTYAKRYHTLKYQGL